jgi:hypothetical protein
VLHTESSIKEDLCNSFYFAEVMANRLVRKSGRGKIKLKVAGVGGYLFQPFSFLFIRNAISEESLLLNCQAFAGCL